MWLARNGRHACLWPHSRWHVASSWRHAAICRRVAIELLLWLLLVVLLCCHLLLVLVLVLLLLRIPSRVRLLRAGRPLHRGRHGRGIPASGLRRVAVGYGLLLLALLEHALRLPRLQWRLRLLLRLLRWNLLLTLLLHDWLSRLGLGCGSHHTPGHALQSVLQRRRVSILLLHMRCDTDQLCKSSGHACTKPIAAKGTIFVCSR